MNLTNPMLVIPNNNSNQLGYLMLIIAGVYIFYIIISTEVKKARIRKLKQATELIKSGHNRIIASQRKEEFQKGKRPVLTKPQFIRNYRD